jgi:hypothetical protein
MKHLANCQTAVIYAGAIVRNPPGKGGAAYRPVMPRGLGVQGDLSWFCKLAIHDQITLLNDPNQRLSRTLARRIAASLSEQQAAQVLCDEESSDGQRYCKLAEPAARQIRDARKKLDAWWVSDSLSDRERRYLIAHRSDDEPPAHAVRVEPAIIRAYLEMKAPNPPPL